MEKEKFLRRPGFLTGTEYIFTGGERGGQRWTVVSPGEVLGKGEILAAMCGAGLGMADGAHFRTPAGLHTPDFRPILLSQEPLSPTVHEPSIGPLCHIMAPGGH